MRLHARVLRRLALLALVASAPLAGLASADTAPQPVLGVVGSDPNAKLAALDPRTLQPLSAPRPVRVQRCLLRSRQCARPLPGPVLSPDGRRVAVVGQRGLTIIGRDRLRVVRTIRSELFRRSGDTELHDLAWSGARSFIVTGTGKFGLALFFLGTSQADIDLEGYEVRTPRGLAVVSPAFDSGFVLASYTPREAEVRLDLPQDAPTTAAVDASRNRMLVVSSTGAVAVVDLATLQVQYRSVVLPRGSGSPSVYAIAWAGQGRLALWGDPLAGGAGLRLVDTRDWTSRLVDPATTDVRAAPNALVTWNRSAATGLTVYAPDGALRFRALADRRVRSVAVTREYAYVDAGSRYSIELRTGRVAGPLKSRAKVVVPDLLDLP